MFRRTSHCVCPPKSSFNVTPLNTDTVFNITASSDDFLMHSPPLPPRTIKNPFTTTTSKYPPNKASITDWSEHHKPNCYDKRSHCNCSRPHSCPADDSQFISTPPIPPKTGTTTNATQIKPKSQKIVFDDHLKKCDQTTNELRKSSRHRNSEKGANRKKSRSNSRSIARDEKSQLSNIDIHVNKYWMKNHENGLEGKIYHKSNELCKICENNEHQKINLTPLLVSNQPDLISDRSGNPIVQSGSVIDPSAMEKPCPMKARSKWRTKLSQLWSRSSKKSSDNSSASPIANRDCLVTPENSGGKYCQDTPNRPRRSKSLHLIPDNSLSPKPSSMQTKSSVPTAADAAITKHSSIFAVISPSTTRWRRNLFCISPKTGSNHANSNSNAGNNPGKNTSTIGSANNNSANITSGANNNKKSDFNQSIGGVNTASNCPQRNASSSISGSRISPVHLLAKSSNNNTSALMTESVRREKDMSISIGGCNNSTGGNMMHSAGKSMKSQNRQEKSDNVTSKLGCGSKTRTRIHQDNMNKPSQSSNVNQPLNISNSPNQLCPCHNYHFNDNHLTCNNGYSRFCTQFPCLHNNPSCQIYNIDSNTNPDITSGCSQICGCMRNFVYFSPNHFHCCHPSNGNTVFCSSCRIPIFCTSCSYNCYNSNSKACGNKQSLCHHSTSPPPCLSRQLPPPPPPPPVTAFSSSHHFPRKNRQSYSKTPPPSFHTHQHSCHDDHCYQEYSVNFNHENCQKQISSKSRTYNFNSAKGGCCCPKLHNNHCYLAPHSKCSGCGSFIYDELGSLSTHYNISGFNKNQFSNTPAADSLLEIKWRNNEPGIINQCRFFAPSINNEESQGRFCHLNHCSNRLSGSCGHYSNEIKSSCCRNRDKQLKRRKSSSHSCHGSNVDQEAEEKFVQQELSRAHFSSPTNNILSSNSVHISPDLNPIIPNTELSSTNNNVNNNSTINNTSSNLSTMQITNHVESNDKFEPWRKTFKENMLALRHLGWYWGPLNHLEAENLVENRPDGTFLVRDSAHDTYFLSLTFRVLGTTYHTRIEYSQGKFSFWSQPESHSATTIVEFIDKAVAHSASGKFHYFLQTSTPGQPPMEVSLLYPLSRYQIVQSLQHLARFVILSNIRKDHVSQLQLPSTLKGYLLEKQYYIDNIEAFVKLTKDAEPLIYEPSRNLINNIHFNSSTL